MLLARLIDITGALGAMLTTLCWLPQALKVVREKDTRAVAHRHGGLHLRRPSVAGLWPGHP
jgi:hypothetical protein